MTDGREILTSIIKTTQTAQYDLSEAIDYVSSTEMKSVLTEQLQSYDSLESEAQLLSSRRGWEIHPNRQLSGRMKHRFRLMIHKTDSNIAEYLIYYHTNSITQGYRIFHRNESYDEQINNLFQKLLFCQSTNIRQMHPFL